jgi:hypothetical protein
MISPKKLQPFFKPFITMFALYSLGMLTLWLSNFSYLDDVVRAADGHTWSFDFARHSSSILMTIMNTNKALADISPIPQIVAMAVLAIASVIVVYVFCDRKIKTLPLLVSGLFVLEPFMFGAWSYKFDAPCMALSILASIIPFLFWGSIGKPSSRREWAIFTSMSVVCLLVMWTSYQASSGIFLVMTIGLLLKEFLSRQSWRHTMLKVVTFISVYLVAGALFFVLFMQESADIGYRSTAMVPISEIIPGVIQNSIGVFRGLYSSLNTEWKILLASMLVAFATSLVLFSRRRRWARLIDLILGLVFIVLSIPLSYGSYLVLDPAPKRGRDLLGIGLVMAIVAILTVGRHNKLRSHWVKLLALPSIILVYSFMVFSWAFGNALADQARYGDFRIQEIASDLSRVEMTTQSKIQIWGNIGEGAVMQHIHSIYPAVGSIFELGHYNLQTTYELAHYYSIGQEFVSAPADKRACDEMTVFTDTLYHTILVGDDDNICIVIK